MEVKFSSPKQIATLRGETTSLDKVNVVRIVDCPDRREVRVRVQELPLPITVLEGDEYREWTKADIVALLEEKL